MNFRCGDPLVQQGLADLLFGRPTVLALGAWVRCVDSIKAGRGSREFGAIIMLPTTVEIKDSDYPGSPARAARTCPKCDHLCSGKMMGGNPNH